jgi:hypothetical protein
MAIAYGAWEREESGKGENKGSESNHRNRLGGCEGGGGGTPKSIHNSITHPRVRIRNNIMTTKPQLVGILAPINEGGGEVTGTKDKNGRKRKKEGWLAMAKWIMCAVNVSSWHTRGPVKGDAHQPPRCYPPTHPRPML